VLTPSNNTMTSSMPESLRCCVASMRIGLENVIIQHGQWLENCCPDVRKQRDAHRVGSGARKDSRHAIHTRSDLEQVAQQVSRHDWRTGHSAVIIAVDAIAETAMLQPTESANSLVQQQTYKRLSVCVLPQYERLSFFIRTSFD
jgi:hypothetical protein